MSAFNAQQARLRLHEHVSVSPSGCWMWTASLSDNGYGRIRFENVEYKSHRLAYEAYVGPIPEGLDLDHLCRIRACCNPEHLEPVTRAENLQRGVWPNALKKECPQGHRYDENNTYINSRGSRECRECRRRSSLAAYYRKQASA